MPAFANVNGETLIECILHVPNFGPWWADVVFERAPDVEGSVTLTVGDLALTGTLSPDHNGTFAEQRKARIVAGGAGWGTLLAPRNYHSDSGVRAQSVAEDAARLSGETIGDFQVDQINVGIDYVRQSGLASRVLEDVIGEGTPWHVGYDGRTNIGPRSTTSADASAYQVLDFNPRDKLAVLGIDNLSSVVVGSIISEGLDSSETVFELEIKVNVDSVRVLAWLGGSFVDRGRIAGLFRGIVNRITDGKLFGLYEFRVVQLSGDRVELQVTEAALGLPNVLPVSMKPGVAGVHAKLIGGSLVLVQFVNGNRARPIITAFAGKDTTGHETDEWDLTVATKIRLGSSAATNKVALAPTIDSQFDKINTALDAFAAAVPVPNDGGLIIHTAFKTPWGVPKPASNVGSTKVVAE